MAAFAFPSRVLVGANTALQTASLLQSLRLRAPLIVTDPYLVNTEAVKTLQTSLNAPVFKDTIADPTTDSVGTLVKAMKSQRFDCVVAIGGGSPIDTAKAGCVLATHGGHMRDYKAPFQMNLPALPLVAIPTTAGTGSEVTKFTIVTDSESNEKMLCIGTSYMPLAAIVDYTLTLNMPKSLTAHTGIDAFCHAMEAYVSKRHNAFADDLALKSIERISKSLAAAFHSSDPWARENMMLASMEAGMAFSSSSVTLIHGMSRPLGANFHVPHGLSNAMLAPAVTRFSLPGAIQRYAQVARVAGWAGAADSDVAAAASVPRALARWNVELDVPTMRQYKLDETLFAGAVTTMALNALASGSPANNPVVPSAEQIGALYEQIFAE